MALLFCDGNSFFPIFGKEKRKKQIVILKKKQLHMESELDKKTVFQP
jgi:hypothetical protein